MNHGFEMKMEADTLVIHVPLGKKALAAAMPSATGKTKLVASSRGALPVGPAEIGAKLALNVTIPNR